MPGWQNLTTICDGIVKPCHFNDFIQLIKNGITDLVLLSTLLAMAVFMYAGFLWLTSGGDSNKHKDAVKMLWNVVIGYVWIISAWVIIYTITSALVNRDFNRILSQ